MNVIKGGKPEGKILIVSLLRLGDIVMQTPALRGIREKYPNHQIDILINENFNSFSSMIPFVDRIEYFPRELLQKSLLDRSTSLFHAMDELTQFVDNMGSYDICINFTQNKLSSYLLKLLTIEKKVGLFYEDQRHIFSNNWFKYLNEYPVIENNMKFHYSDILRKSVDYEYLIDYSLNSSPNMSSDLFRLTDHENYIVFQPLSSDEKKNLPLSTACNTIRKLLSKTKNNGIYILAAPNEVKKLNRAFCEFEIIDPRVKVIPTTLQESYSVIQKAKLVVTVDTIFKHMACAASVSVMELSLGSSDIHMTGAYGKDSIILAPRDKCYPCPHSSACNLNYACNESFSADVISDYIKAKLTSPAKLNEVANKHAKTVKSYYASLSRQNFWYLNPLTEAEVQLSALKLVTLYCINFLKEQHDKQAIPPFASQAMNLYRDLSQVFKNESVIANFIERQLQQSEGYEDRFFIIKRNLLEQMLKQTNRGKNVEKNIQ